jgi:hypothetical protein
MTASNTYKLPLPGGGTAELFDPNGPVGLKRWRAFAAKADELRIDRPVLELRDVILCHGHDRSCLYDAQGVRIDASALWRYEWHGEDMMFRAAPTLPSPGAVSQTVEEPVVFSSIFFNHWGHFLLESIARLSVAISDPELARLPSVFSCMSARAHRLPPIAEFFDLIGAPRLETSEPIRVRLRHCLVPPPAFGHEGFADPRHLAAPREVARRAVGEAAGEGPPVYFSRTRVASAVPMHTACVNEPELETRLAALGVEIVHMQELPLAEQIRVVNRRRAIIGLWGSALHNILFALDGAGLSTFVIIKPGQRAGNFLLVDSIVGNRAHYLATLQTDASGDPEIDIEATMAYLDSAGVFQ